MNKLNSQISTKWELIIEATPIVTSKTDDSTNHSDQTKLPINIVFLKLEKLNRMQVKDQLPIGRKMFLKLNHLTIVTTLFTDKV